MQTKFLTVISTEMTKIMKDGEYVKKDQCEVDKYRFVARLYYLLHAEVMLPEHEAENSVPIAT
jgi:hypothetical protein